MAAFLVAALCVPEAFDELGLTIAIAYGVVRVCHIFLFMLASVDDPDMRQSVLGPRGRAPRSASACSSAPPSSTAGRRARSGRSRSRSTPAGPYFFGSEGWKLVPEHFAERHGADPDRRAGGVDRRDRRRRRDRGHDRRDRGRDVRASESPRRSGGPTSTSRRSRRHDASHRGGRPGAQRAGPRLLLLHPLHLVAGIVLVALGDEEDDRAHVRAAEDRAGVRAGRRPGDVPARAGRLPLPQHPLVQQRRG